MAAAVVDEETAVVDEQRMMNDVGGADCEMVAAIIS